jgi:AraC family transcriptional regulator
MEFLKGVRLDRAIQNLTRTDLPVKVVAARAGYSSRSSFSRAFLARHGTGPAAYRAAAARRRDAEPRHNAHCSARRPASA